MCRCISHLSTECGFIPKIYSVLFTVSMYLSTLGRCFFSFEIFNTYVEKSLKKT